MLIGLGTKSGKIKMQGLEWEKRQNVGTKNAFKPYYYY